MIKARHTWWFELIFYPYLRAILRKNFRSIAVHGGCSTNGPILMVGNHSSWWDGFWVWHLVHDRWQKRLFTMMLEEQLSRHSFLSLIGGFSIKRGSRSVVESLSYASDLLNDAKNVVLLFPQGGIQSSYNHHIKFEKGIARILEQSTDAGLVGVVMLTDYCSSKRPYLDIYIAELDRDNPQQSYQRFYDSCIKRQEALCKQR